MVDVRVVKLSARTQTWCAVIVVLMVLVEVATLNGVNVCMVKQKYNITKRVKYRAPMSVRTYEWCMSIPPRCSKWSTEMRDLTRLETEERTAEVAVCCPGYKMKDVSCVPICPNGRTGHGCSQDCPPNKWGPNCVNECQPCSDHGICSPITGVCSCQEGWQGESCESRMTSTTSTTSTTTSRVEELLTKITATKTTLPSSVMPFTTSKALVETTSMPTTITTEIITSSLPTIIELSSTKLSVFHETTTPMTTSVEIIQNPKKIKAGDNIQPSIETILSESAIPKIHNSSILSTTTFMPTTAITDVTLQEKQNTKSLVTVLPETSAKKIGISTIIKDKEIVSSKNTAFDKVSSVTSATNELHKSTPSYSSVSTPKIDLFKPAIQITQEVSYNRTEPTHDTRNHPKEVHVEIKTTPVKILKTSDTNLATAHKTTAISIITETPIVSTHATTITEGTTKLETSRRPDATIRYFPTTIKFKPKEIWIRPAQKGQETFAEAKKTNHELHLRHRFSTNKESASNTTPKTIIVSIIPTSVSYATFKKIALSTASVSSQTTNATVKTFNIPASQGFTKPMSVLTSIAPTPSAISSSSTSTVAHTTQSITLKSIIASKPNEHFRKIAKTFTTLPTPGTSSRHKTLPPNGTNSMTTVAPNLNSSNSVTSTVSLTNFTKTSHKLYVPIIKTNKEAARQLERVTKPIVKAVTAKPVGKNDTEKTNATKIRDITNARTNKMTTENLDDEETFHILTEPEHITAVMEGKGKERTSVDLISVISIAGGIMMAVITVAVIIVMVERCRRPRYDDVRKMNDIHMQVMIDNNDVPPPYVRSIFHTPLPEPPSLDKCHYQPISTLDRNLKQFMRPVVVQTISPIMLENFRGILECHYDHLPRRSQDFEVRPKHHSIPPSNEDPDELAHLRPCSIAESTIDALKCEAKLDVLDSTTSEPLYAEIPCWRPPSEHAIEVMNYNGEAVTEL